MTYIKIVCKSTTEILPSLPKTLELSNLYSTDLLHSPTKKEKSKEPHSRVNWLKST